MMRSVSLGLAVFLIASAAQGRPEAPRTAAASAGEDVVHLHNGDRITGRLVSETARGLRLQTAFGRLDIPRSRVARLVRADGREETFLAWDQPKAAVPKEPALAVTVTGKTFWHAWERRTAPAAPSLRLQVEVDGEVMATYLDGKTDPEAIRGAVVNTFSFPDVSVQGGRGAGVAPPEVTAGRIHLRIALPVRTAGRRLVRMSYGVLGPDGAWRRVSSAETMVEVVGAHETPLDLRQDLGQMEFSRREMRNLETFTLDLAAAPPRPRTAA